MPWPPAWPPPPPPSPREMPLETELDAAVETERLELPELPKPPELEEPEDLADPVPAARATVVERRELDNVEPVVDEPTPREG